MDEGLVVNTPELDISKAFHMVPHRNLIEKFIQIDLDWNSVMSLKTVWQIITKINSKVLSLGECSVRHCC